MMLFIDCLLLLPLYVAFLCLVLCVLWRRSFWFSNHLVDEEKYVCFKLQSVLWLLRVVSLVGLQSLIVAFLGL